MIMDVEPEWSITFDDTQSLRCIVESAAAVMSKVIFKVKKVGEYYFLMVDGADCGYTCCVSARLQLQNVRFAASHVDEFSFCVDCKQMSYSIDNPSCSHGFCRMEGYTHNATIGLIMCDPDNDNSQDLSILKTFVDSDPPSGLCSLSFDTMLEIDLAKLKDIVKKSRKAHAEHLQITIYTKTAGATEQSIVVFAIDGDTDHKQVFCNETTKHYDGSLIVRAAASSTDQKHSMVKCDEATKVFDGSFPIEKIDAFVRNIPVRMVVAKVQNGMPLMLTHPLGDGEDEESHVRFLVASKNDDEMS